MAASSILPVEVWKMVLDNLKDPQDLLHSSNVCFMWEAILEKRKPLYNFQLILPHLFPYLFKDDVLKCCQVSHAWNQTMDTYNNHLNVTNDSWNIQRDGDLTYFSQHTPVNLSTYRNVHFYHNVLNNDLENEEFENLLESKEYLTKVGGLIRHLSVDVRDLCWEAILCEWLWSTPNVTNLNVWMDWVPTFHLEHVLLPELPHLTQINYWIRSPASLNLLLTRYGAQLKKLQIRIVHLGRGNANTPDLRPQEGMLFSRLQNFDVAISSQGQIDAWRTCFQQQNVKLKTLAILCLCEVDRNVANAIVEFTNGHCELEEFRFAYQIYYWSFSLSHIPFEGLQNLRLPNAKKVEFYNVGLPTTKMLLKVAPLISKIKIMVYVAGRWDTDFINLYEKPEVWVMLPALKSVNLRFLLKPSYEHLYYTRAMYNYLKAEIEKDEAELCNDDSIPH